MLSGEIAAFLRQSTVVGGDLTSNKALSSYLSALRRFGWHLPGAGHFCFVDSGSVRRRGIFLTCR
jgi:hypothetical protein